MKDRNTGDLLYKDLAYAVVGAAMEVHSILGPGFTETVYQTALERELTLRRIPFVAQKRIQVCYKDVLVADYYLDLVVDDKIDVELKAVDQLAPVHVSQVLSYLKASGLKLGLLINFGEARLRFQRIAL
ncbi:MAG: GxxExxY protein [Chloroflexi bacterium]|nr:GxxExxY protein [Chloroflexota bacterium]